MYTALFMGLEDLDKVCEDQLPNTNLKVMEYINREQFIHIQP